MPAEAHHLNLVFQGGGVRGIAYAGVLSGMPASCKLHGVGGTSAGALVAALLAAGKTVADLRGILSSPDLFDLLDPSEAVRTERLKGFLAAARAEFDRAASAHKLGRLAAAKRLWTLASLLSRARADLEAVWRARGLHDSAKLRKWIDRQLEGLTFADVRKKAHVDDLRIVAADVNGQSYRVFDVANDSARPVAEAVHAAVSIPIFFTPFTAGPHHFVDGGILSNFPNFLFAQSQHPTIGFRLEDVPPLRSWAEVASARTTAPIRSNLDYILLLLRTMVEAHDKFRQPPPNFTAYVVDTPDSIPSFKFNLSQEEASALYDKGVIAGSKVAWDAGSSGRDTEASYDPKPAASLQRSMRNAKELEGLYYKQRQFVERLVQSTVFTVRIDADWTTRYERVFEVEVFGARPLILQRQRAIGFRPGSSLADAFPVWDEITPNGIQPLPVVPTSATERERGFLAFYAPPVEAGQPARKFRTEVEIPRELEATVGAGGADTLVHSVRQIAEEYRMSLTFRVEVDADLGPLQFAAEFEPQLQRAEQVRRAGREYRVWESVIKETPIVGVRRFEVEVKGRPAIGTSGSSKP
jgi:NTE family protein